MSKLLKHATKKKSIFSMHSWNLQKYPVTNYIVNNLIFIPYVKIVLCKLVKAINK